jgi:4-hydroxy 2-oxovalerate aldolase
MQHMIEFLSVSGVDVIEIGYFRRSGITDDMGIAAWCPDNLLASLPKSSPASFAVMVRPGTVTPQDVLGLRNTAISLVRIPVTQTNIERGIELAESARSIGISVSLNIIRASELDDQAINSLLKNVSSFEPDVLYYADSNGAMFPEQVGNLFSVAKTIAACPLGFHAHDGLHFSVANCWSALQRGATWLDCSISGLGKGGGNAPTEKLLALVRHLDGRDIQLSVLLNAVELCQDGLFPPRLMAGLKGVAYALLNYNLDDIREFEEQADKVPKSIDKLFNKSALLPSLIMNRGA